VAPDRPQIAPAMGVGVGSHRRTGHAGLVSSWPIPGRPPCAPDSGAPQIQPTWLLPWNLARSGGRWHSLWDLPLELALVAMVVYYLAMDRAASARR